MFSNTNRCSPLIIISLTICLSLTLVFCNSGEESNDTEMAISSATKEDSPGGNTERLPHPKPVFGVRTTPAPEGITAPVVVVGNLGIGSLGKVILHSSVETITAPIGIEGNFVAMINAQGGEKIEMKIISSEHGEYPPFSVTIAKQPEPFPFPPPQAIPAVSPITRISTNRVIIQGQSFALPKSKVIGVNYMFGDAVTAMLDEQQRFQLEIKALTGEEIWIYDDYRTMLGEPWSLIAP